MQAKKVRILAQSLRRQPRPLAERREAVPPEALHGREGMWGGSFQKTSGTPLIPWGGRGIPKEM